MKKILFSFVAATAMLFAACTSATDNPVIPQPSDNPGVNELLTDVEEGIVTPGIADATLDTERGVVVCSTCDPKKYGLPEIVAALFGPESFHGHDWGFYYLNIRKNAEDRINAYFSK